MFSTIFKQELKYWFNRPAFYIYISIFFVLAFFLSAASAGFFDSVTATTGSSRIVNSPIGISGLFNALTIFIFFLFPSIVGVSVYRDFKSEMHTILYSYPFTKANYLFAKFFSAITIVSIIVFSIALGMIIGFRFPGTNSDIVGAFNITSYLQTYFVFILPNVLLFGAIVFAVVAFTRNIAAGFITVIILMFGQGVLESLLSDPEHRALAAILDPFGSAATNYYTKYWTPSEQNELQIPIKEMIVYNRLLWLAISTVIFGLVYRFFTFSQNAISISFRKTKGERITKTNFSGITKITLPKVSYDYSFLQNLKTTWRLSNIDFKYIIKSWAFISIVLVGLILIVVMLSEVGNLFGTPTLPVTWKMINLGGVFFGSINICTFLYAGMLVHRAKIAKINHLVDATPIPNWTLLFSKLIALIKMQLVLLAVIIISGMAFQVYKGYYDFEIGHYFLELYFLSFISLIIWALLSIFVQTLIGNPYLGLFVLLVISIGMPFLSLAGIEQSIFKYNQGPGFNYSDMNGYGATLLPYLSYKIYWILCGLLLLIVSFLFWVRGIPSSFVERIEIAKTRFKGFAAISFGVFLMAFLALGYSIYQETGTKSKKTSSKQAELQSVSWEKTYKKYEGYAQPRIVSVTADVNIFPKERLFDAAATYIMVNKTNEAIDTLFLNHNSLESTFEFNKENTLVLEDTIQHFDMYQFKNKILPGDTLQLSFTVKSKKNTNYRRRSPVRENGTFINNFAMFPSLGYSSQAELTDNKTRKKYKLPVNDLRPEPTDSTALGDTYISKDSDWIDFEATVSTSKDQIAIAPGYLQKEWTEGNRKYFHYKMDSKILNFYAFNSARYQVKKELWKGISLEIYYHKGHEYNLDRMMKGMKASLDYNSKNFSPYQHKQLRIVEFPRTGGSYAQSFPNTIPFSEGVGFIADVDDKNDDGVDYPFAITVHEVAHQWWAHQVIGADVLGATMLSESLSEYVALKVLEHQQGKEKMRTFLKKALDDYLMQRTMETKRENALMYNDGQGYIRYQKGSLVFYALSDYIGEENLNGALKKYVEKVKFQEAPYTTSVEMVNYIKAATPDSLQYVIKDMFETITLYRNRVLEAKSTELENGKYKVEIEFEVSKYRNDEKGKRYYGEQVGDTLSYKTDKMNKAILSVPLADYIDIGIFTEEEVDGMKKEKELYLQKHKITQINNKVTIIVDKKPVEVGVDPYNKLIDTQSDDNRRKL
ncbi:ABC transporter permease/M1 family aminopeptidase [Polaribacter staleyi]|uniref:ABC transporter permease/M1 family aminopeptidase n=1 Tax=Polaribacter staleyi TaxID=2022337 RepID=UPI0031BA5080